jgi:Domain of unknown function (DUF1961)
MTSRFCLFTLIVCALQANPSGGQVNSKHGQILYSETFDENRSDLDKDWRLEGTGRAWIEDGRLMLQEDTAGVGMVLWMTRNWPADVELSFDLSFSNNRGIGVFFIAARGADGEDAFETPTERTGDYEEYIHGDLDSYSLSLHRYFPDGANNPGSNLRRNSGFHLLHAALPDPVLESSRVYSVVVRKSGASIQVSVDGKVVHDYSDEDPLGSGKIGFRLRGDVSCRMALDNVVIHGL